MPPEPRQGMGTSLRLRQAERNVRTNFPGIGGLPFKVQAGEGPGFAEFFPADESMNPNPGTATIEVRRFDLPQKELESVILGDILHLAPQLIPEFQELKQQFIGSLQPSQLAVAEQMFKQSGGGRTFEQFLDQVASDAFIRDFVFQSEGSIPGGEPFVSGVGPVMGAFFENQIPILEGLRDIIKRKRK